MAKLLVVLNDEETYAGLGGCQLVVLLRKEDEILEAMGAGDDLAALDDYKEGEDYRRLDLKKIVNAYLESIPEGAELKETCPVLWMTTVAVSPVGTDTLHGNDYHALVRAGTEEEARQLAEKWGEGVAFEHENGDAEELNVVPAPTTNEEWMQYFPILEEDDETDS